MSEITFIVVSSVHWHFTWQSVHNITRELAQRGYDVIFIEPLPKRWPRLNEFNRVIGRLRKSRLGGGKVFQHKPKGVKYLSPILLPDTGKLAQWINRHIFVKRLTKDILALSRFQTKVVLNYLPTPASIALQINLKPDASIYICFWDFCNDPHAGTITAEPEMFRCADAVIADSPENIRRAEAQHNLVLHSEGGVDLDVFLQHEYLPARRTNDPLCIYFGTIGNNIDQELLEQVSCRYRLKLIGPMDTSKLKISTKASFVGPVSFEELPSHLIDGDVLLLPYACKPHTIAVTPAKLFECLATGKPIVAINLPSLSKYSNVIYNCISNEHFIEAIRTSTSEHPELREKRIQIAKANSWQTFIDKLEKLIGVIIANKNGCVNDPTQ